MTREPVIIERGDGSNPKGLPRPLAEAQGVLRPVPWTNGEDWGVIHFERGKLAEKHSLCLVCGECVTEGFIVARDKDAPVHARLEDLDKHAADNAPLHARCAKMTVAHCRHIREQLLKGELFMVPYKCRQIA